MDNTLTMDSFIALAREHADVEGLTDRHSSDQMVRWGNLSWRLMRAMVTNLGYDYFRTRSAVAQLPTSLPYTGANHLEVALPAGAVGVFGFDVLLGSRYAPLKPTHFNRRADMRCGDPSSGYLAGKDYLTWYLPVWQDIASGDSDTFLMFGSDIWVEWAIMDMVERAALKDNDSENTAALAGRRKSELYADLKKSALKMQQDSPRRPVRRSGTTVPGWYCTLSAPSEDGAGAISSGVIALMPNLERRR